MESAFLWERWLGLISDDTKLTPFLHKILQWKFQGQTQRCTASTLLLGRFSCRDRKTFVEGNCNCWHWVCNAGLLVNRANSKSTRGCQCVEALCGLWICAISPCTCPLLDDQGWFENQDVYHFLFKVWQNNSLAPKVPVWAFHWGFCNDL